MTALLTTSIHDRPTTSQPAPSANADRRVLVVWCPDWPVISAVASLGLVSSSPIAVIDRGEVYACSQAARLDGVRRGMRRRDASARCPELTIVDHSVERDVRAFESILSTIEDTTSAVTPIRPGLCALSVPSRYYGGEREAAAVIAEQLVAAGLWECRIGIADGIFAAEQAARQAAPQDCCVIPTGGSARFLADLPIMVLEDLELVSLLRRLGIRTLGDFAALPARDVLTRFGSQGALIHRLAGGSDSRIAAARRPPLDLQQSVPFDPPLETVEPVAFSSRQTAERLIAELARHGLVCSEIRIEVVGDRGWVGSRVWAHPRWFTAADLVDRLYWQLQGDPSPEPVEGIRLIPEAVESLADHGEGLWGSAPDERIERGVARLQGMLGPEQVLSPSLQGGRNPRQRQVLTPWGERGTRHRATDLPWPGSIPPPAPTRVFPEPRPAAVFSADGCSVEITDRGAITGEPARLRTDDSADPLVIEAWAGPWPIDELWWEPKGARRVARLQMVTVDGSAWLLLVEGDQWWTEARYE
ncbi:MAG TPA: DNA polymerase Y family protein [Propionibacteriaceae bacterium]|jgi:protein ImuB|nr:DNA polymerase Y family protein [Propionibacteriaceae bacterium]